MLANGVGPLSQTRLRDSKERLSPHPVRAEDLDELDERLAVALERRTHDELARAVVAAADRAELHAGDAGALEVNDVGGPVAPDAQRVAGEMALGDLPQRLDVRVLA